MTDHKIFILLLATISIVGTQPGHGQGAPASNQTWEAAARLSGLSAADIALLQTNRMLIANEAHKQIFSAYIGGKTPLFITSDSLLNAYHILYEESILRLENARAARLPGVLQTILNNLEDAGDHLKGKPALVAAARARARLVPGIALRLMDDSFRFKDDSLNALLEQETKQIVTAQGVGRPKWLGQADPSFVALDYSRYKPRGFYTRSEQLTRYFRAVAWLQSIPFRVSKDEELLAMLMLGNSVTGNRFKDFARWSQLETFVRAYQTYIGAGDDWDIMTAAQEAQNQLEMNLDGDDLQKKRDWLMQMAGGHGEGPLINDQMRFAPDDPQLFAEPQFRILSAYRTPSAMLFQRTTDRRHFTRPYPTGLEVPIALGSVFAGDHIEDPQKQDLLKTIAACKTYFQGGRMYYQGESLYFKYLEALKALLVQPEPDAPDFMKNEAWQTKSCNTVLAGWAQLSHTWALQAKQTVNYLGVTRTPVGFVEPVPEFFSRMAGLAEATKSRLKESGAFAPDTAWVVQKLEQFKTIMAGVKDYEEFLEKITKLPPEDGSELYLALLHEDPARLEMGSRTSSTRTSVWIDGLVADIKQGQMGKAPWLVQLLKEYDFDLEDLWERFERVSRRLEALAHKQLRGVDLNDSENAFIQTYGETIAGIMLYGGNSYENPRDDAPRVVDVYANAEAGGYLHVGIARPRALYVLYPWKGQAILCRGAVMPYYEFAATTRHTDASWKQMLDSEKRPSIPKWLAPVVSGGTLSKSKLKDEH
jgi:hypothetical protein